jgi:polyisoprenoid-binding protein YceI
MSRSAPVALALALVAAPAIASTWEIDASHSTAQFSVRHLVISNTKGVFTMFRGMVNVPEEDLAKMSLEASVDVASLDTREPKRDAHLKSADFFDVASHPAMTFVSKRVEKLAEDRLKVVGDLTIRGKTKEVVLDVANVSAPVSDPWGNVRRGATATTTINRQDFGVSWNKTLETGGLVVGNDVAITLELELVKIPEPAPAEPEGK